MGVLLTTTINSASAPVPGDVRSGWPAEGSTECRSSCKGQGAPRESGGAPLTTRLEDKSDGPRGGRGGLQFTNRKKVQFTTDDAKQAQRLTRKEIAEAVAVLGWAKLADRLKECGDKVYTFRCKSCDTTWESPSRCHHRLCPECAPVRAMRLFDRHEKLMSVPHLKHLVLTVQTSVHISPELVRSIVGAFNRLRNKVFYRKSWRGGVRQVEFVYTPQNTWEFDHRRKQFFRKTPGWHIHIHCLIDGKYVPQDKIAKDWKVVTKGLGTIIWIERAKNPMQALKYVLKPDLEILQCPEALDGFIETIQSLHLVSGFGLYWKVRGERFPAEGRLCPNCHCSAVEFLGSRFVFFYEAHGGRKVLPELPPPPDYQLAFPTVGQRRLL